MTKQFEVEKKEDLTSLKLGEMILVQILLGKNVAIQLSQKDDDWIQFKMDPECDVRKIISAVEDNLEFEEKLDEGDLRKDLTP